MSNDLGELFRKAMGDARVNDRGYFRDITADDLLALISSTPAPEPAHWHFRIAGIRQYLKLARTLSDGASDIIASDRITIWCPIGTARKIRKHVRAVRAARTREELIAGINPS